MIYNFCEIDDIHGRAVMIYNAGVDDIHDTVVMIYNAKR